MDFEDFLGEHGFEIAETFWESDYEIAKTFRGGTLALVVPYIFW